MAVNIPGLVAMVIFYIIITIIGIIGGRKTARSNNSEGIFVANRSIGMWLAFFTLSATNIGGGYINGTAEAMAFGGLIWTNAPVLYSISIVIVGVLYAPKMRRGGYTTMFDPIQMKFGNRAGGLLFFPHLMGDLFWSAAILSALGSTVSIILDIDPVLSIIVSACVAVFYTFLGGLYSVAYTDVVQLICLAVGLFVSFPFAFFHPSVDLSRVQNSWVGELPKGSIGYYVDLSCQLLFGALPWQVIYQRILACKTPNIARNSTVMAALTSFIMAIPPAVIGIVGAATDWNATSYEGPIPIPKEQHSFILPMVIHYLCPLPVAVVGIGVVAAAVMSSADSAILGTGTIVAKNIYKDVFRPKASDREMIWVMRISIVVTGALACVIAILVKTVYGLFYLCSDLMYVILFPQLTCVLWLKDANTYGSISAFAASLFLRVAAGDPLLKLSPLIRYPFYTKTDGQQFPFRTLAMLVNFILIIIVSKLTNMVFRRGWLSLKFDIFDVIKREDDRRVAEERGKSLIEHQETTGVGESYKYRHKQVREETHL